MTAVKIGEIEFPTRIRAEQHCRAILARHNDLEPIRSEIDQGFVASLIEAHPRKKYIVDCGVKYVFVQWLDPRGVQRRFCVKRIDGSIRDFSWRTVVYPRDAKQDLRRVLRTLVQPQISAFRHRYFELPPPHQCDLSGYPLTPSNSDVDHLAPDTFEAIVSAWLRVLNLGYEDIEIEHGRGYEEASRLVDRFLEKDWADFHFQKARLRVIHRDAHRSLRRGDGGQRNA